MKTDEIKKLDSEKLNTLISELSAKSKNTGLNNNEKLTLKGLEKELKVRAKKAAKSTKSIEDSVFVSDRAKEELTLKYVEIDKIDFPDFSDRIEFSDSEENVSLLSSIKKVGIIQEPLLMDMGNGRFKKLVGGRRILATKSLGHTKVRVKTIDKDTPEEIQEMIIWFENTARKDYNAYEVARFHIKKILDEFKDYSDDIKTETLQDGIVICNNARYFQKEKRNEEYVQKVQTVLERLEYIKSISSLCKATEILNMEEYVVKAISSNKISFVTAQVLRSSVAKLKNHLTKEKIRSLHDEIISGSMTSTQAIELINLNLPKVKQNVLSKKAKELDKKMGKIKKTLSKLSDEKIEKIIELLDKELA